MSLIIAIIVLLVVTGALYGIWSLIQRRQTLGMPSTVAGIILILIFLLFAMWLFNIGNHASGPYLRRNVSLPQPCMSRI